jgi:hypothetical protein
MIVAASRREIPGDSLRRDLVNMMVVLFMMKMYGV